MVDVFREDQPLALADGFAGAHDLATRRHYDPCTTLEHVEHAVVQH